MPLPSQDPEFSGQGGGLTQGLLVGAVIGLLVAAAYAFG